MTRILILQALRPIGAERVGADAQNAISSCSYMACNCSSDSWGACGPPPPACVAV